MRHYEYGDVMAAQGVGWNHAMEKAAQQAIGRAKCIVDEDVQLGSDGTARVRSSSKPVMW